MLIRPKLLVLSAAAIALMSGALSAQVTWNIDLTKGQSAISPFIYGVNTRKLPAMRTRVWITRGMRG